jgi:hypothetical protein
MRISIVLPVCMAAALAAADLETGWRNPPPEARPHTYWLWLNGYVDPATARAELQAMKDAGFGGVLLFDMGARGDKSAQPPAGPAFLSAPWMKQFRESVQQAKQLGLQVDFSVVTMAAWDSTLSRPRFRAGVRSMSFCRFRPFPQQRPKERTASRRSGATPPFSPFAMRGAQPVTISFSNSIPLSCRT